MNKKHFRLAHAIARQRAIDCVREAPDGYVVTVAEPNRSLDQNALMWPLLERFAEQLRWPINGELRRLEPEEWKDILTAAFSQEQQRVAPGIHGGMVLLGLRTSKFGRERMSEFIEFILAVGAERGVRFEAHHHVP